MHSSPELPFELSILVSAPTSPSCAQSLNCEPYSKRQPPLQRQSQRQSQRPLLSHLSKNEGSQSILSFASTRHDNAKAAVRLDEDDDDDDSAAASPDWEPLNEPTPQAIPSEPPAVENVLLGGSSAEVTCATESPALANVPASSAVNQENIQRHHQGRDRHVPHQKMQRVSVISFPRFLRNFFAPPQAASVSNPEASTVDFLCPDDEPDIPFSEDDDYYVPSNLNDHHAIRRPLLTPVSGIGSVRPPSKNTAREDEDEEPDHDSDTDDNDDDSFFAAVFGYSLHGGISAALDTLASQAAVSIRDRTLASVYLQRCLVINALVMIVLSPLWFFAAVPLLNLTHLHPNTISAASNCIPILFVGLPGYFIDTCMTKFLQAHGLTMLALVAALPAAAVNGALLCTPLTSFAHQGALGGSYATIIADTISAKCAVILVQLSKRRTHWHPWPRLRWWRSDRNQYRRHHNHRHRHRRHQSQNIESSRFPNHDNDNDNDDESALETGTLHNRGQSGSSLLSPTVSPEFSLDSLNTSAMFNFNGGDSRTPSLWSVLGVCTSAVVMMCSEWWLYVVMAIIAVCLSEQSVYVAGEVLFLCVPIHATYIGLAGAASKVVGNTLGHGSAQDARAAARIYILLTFLLSSTISIAIIVFRKRWGWFLIENCSDKHESMCTPAAESGAALASKVLPYGVLLHQAAALNTIMGGILRGSGHQQLGAVLSFLILTAFGLPFAFILCLFTGLEIYWVMLAFAIALFLNSTAQFAYLAGFMDWTQAAQRGVNPSRSAESRIPT